MLVIIPSLVSCVSRQAVPGNKAMPSSPPPAVQGVRLEPTPTSVLSACQAQPLVAPACPSVLPAVPRYKGRVIERAGPWETFNISFRYPYGSPRRDRPPNFLHVVVEGGDLRGAYPFALPQSGPGLTVSDALLTTRRPEPVLIGRPDWGGRDGRLILMPSYRDAPTIHADHLMYVWEQDGIDLVLSLHAWTPLTQAVRVLEAMVVSLQAEGSPSSARSSPPSPRT